MFDWLDNTVIKLCTMPPVGTDLNTVKDQLNEMKVCPWERFLKEDCFVLSCVCFVLGVRGGKVLQVVWPFGCARSGPCCCAPSFSSCGESGLGTCCGAQTSVFSGAQAYLPCRMWNLLTPGIKQVSPALAGGLFIPEPPERSHFSF